MENGGKVVSCSRIKDENRRLLLKEVEYEGFGRSILRAFIIHIARNRLQSTCVDLMGFGEATTSEGNRLEELRLR